MLSSLSTVLLCQPWSVVSTTPSYIISFASCSAEGRHQGFMHAKQVFRCPHSQGTFYFMTIASISFESDGVLFACCNETVVFALFLK